MRDLDSINPADAKPCRFVGLGAIIPLAFSTFGLVLASDAAPTVSAVNNPIFVFSSVVLAISFVMLFVPRLFHWDWQTKYFGVSMFHLGGLMLMWVLPCLCLVLYSKLALPLRVAILLIYTGAHAFWARRFVIFYQKINADQELRSSLYEEDEDAVYYMQWADRRFLETKYNFVQLPQDRYIAIFLLVALLMTPMMSRVSAIVGIPFIHVFFLIATLPLSLMGLGFVTRGWLVFYYYPMIIHKRTGKRVYVDMSSKSKVLRKKRQASADGSSGGL